MTHIRCNTIKWLSRRSITQLIVIFASPSLPLIALMLTMGCGANSELNAGVVCSLIETGLMLCGAAIGVLVAFEIYLERRRKDEDRGGRPNGSGPSTTKESSRRTYEDEEGSQGVDQNSKNARIGRVLQKWAGVFALIVIAGTGITMVSNTDMLDVQSNQTSKSMESDTLFTAAATILGFAMFGSALTRVGHNKDLIRSTVSVLTAIGVIQALFMMSLVSDFNIPAIWWIGMTMIVLLMLMLIMASGTIRSDGTGGDARPSR